MSNWFDRAFATMGEAIGEARHELLGGWFGRTFEPHPSQSPGGAEEMGQEHPAQGHGHDFGMDR